jgi:hypothetical protein
MDFANASCVIYKPYIEDAFIIHIILHRDDVKNVVDLNKKELADSDIEVIEVYWQAIPMALFQLSILFRTNPVLNLCTRTDCEIPCFMSLGSYY